MLSESLPCAHPLMPTLTLEGYYIPTMLTTAPSLSEVSGLFSKLQRGRSGIQTWFSVGILLKQVFWVFLY